MAITVSRIQRPIQYAEYKQNPLRQYGRCPADAAFDAAFPNPD
jgi:hypothetical protein